MKRKNTLKLLIGGGLLLALIRMVKKATRGMSVMSDYVIRARVRRYIPRVANQLSDSQMKMAVRIVKTAKNMGIDSDVDLQALLVIAFLESSFRPIAVSEEGARGVFQLTDIAIEDLRENGIAHEDDPFRIQDGIEFYKLLKRRRVYIRNAPVPVQMAVIWLCGSSVSGTNVCDLSGDCWVRAVRASQIIDWPIHSYCAMANQDNFGGV